jgi:transposase
MTSLEPPTVLTCPCSRQAFQQLWEYNSPGWAGELLDEWCRQTERSRIEPMKKIVRSLRQHRELILNYFRAQKLISSGVVEDLNNKAKVPRHGRTAGGAPHRRQCRQRQ